MKIHLYCLVLFCLLTNAGQAQIGLGGTPHPSAALDVPSTTKAAYLPRMSSAQRMAIINPQVGAIVYDLDKATLYLYDGQNWLPLATTSANELAPVSRTPSDPGTNDSFGFSVSISGNYAVVGAPYADVGSNNIQGSAYIFVRSGNTWTQQAKLVAEDGETDDFFGNKVAIAGDYAIVGAVGDGIGTKTTQGSAYIFVRSGTDWSQQAKLTASDGLTNDFFGSSVAISGDYAIVGAYGDDIGSNANQGSAYIFLRSGKVWSQQQKLTAPDGAASDEFGIGVTLSGDYAAVGAHYDQVGSNFAQGSVHVFVRSGTTWNWQQQLTAFDGATIDFFGYSVSLSGNYLVVGAFGADVGSTSAQGSAYVFGRSGTTWNLQTKLSASDGAAGNRYGISVSVSGDYLIIGSPNHNSTQGAAYLYRFLAGQGWTLVRQIRDNAPTDTFNGYSVGISNGTFIIGGPDFQLDKGKVSFGMVE